jgi:hypothetical protein
VELPKRVMARLRVDLATGCWLWTASLTRDGYGKAWWGKSIRAHRLVWMLLRGPIDDEKKLLHRCDRPACCNPDHLFVGTQRENVEDMDRKGRRKPVHGGAHWNARLTADKARIIRERYAAGGVTQAQLGAILGVSEAAVSDVLRGRTWKSA